MSEQAVTVGSTLEVRGHTLKNRLAKGAMSEALANQAGEVNEQHLRLYETWAQGGLGTSITGNVMIDRRAKNEPGVVIVEDEHDLPMLRRWAEIGKRYQMTQLVQLSHPGKQCPRGLNIETVAPSAVPFRRDMQQLFATPRALTEAEILDLIERFGRSAAICEKAGFEGVQLHGAHGYLISEFLSPKDNIRTDQWGGSIENRMRFLLESVKAVRAQTSEQFILSVKLNSSDFQKGGFSEEDSLTVIKALDALGVDMIEISGGTYEAPAMTGGKPAQKESTRQREAYFLTFAERIRSEVKHAKLMVTGGFRTRQGMDDALQSGACELIGVARPLAVEPDAPDQLMAGHNVRYAVKPIKTGIKPFDQLGVMEIIWYAAQFKSMGKGKAPNPKLSPLLVFAGYVRNNIKATLQGKQVFGRLRAKS